jgi:predicted AAA+ superfamily ATPase
MNYRTRFIEKKIKQLASYYKVILVTGTRQVGKSTILTKLFPDYKHITFDPVQDIYRARIDPDLFLDNFPSPLILDEIQYVPELLPAIKRRVDNDDSKGQYFLTGSQNLSMLKTVSESMAGRVGIIKLENMLPIEMIGIGNTNKNWLNKFLNDPQIFDGKISLLSNFNTNLVEFLWRGTMPGLLDMPDSIVPTYYDSYVQTYIERDVRTIANIKELRDFGMFIRIGSALTSQEINSSQIGREIGITPDTARRWLNILNYSYQWIELPPYFGNTIKRVSKKKKGYFTDTGLICYLQSISSPDALAASPNLGAIFETFAVNLIIKQISRLKYSPTLYHWRTNGGAEVDVVLEIDNNLFPIEIKCKTNLSLHDTRGIKSFMKTYSNKCNYGIIFYAGKECYRISEFIWAIPWLAI